MVAHNVASKRAMKDFQEVVPGFEALLNENWDAISAGSPFPDYMYACGDFHGAGEEAHWTPWQEVAVNYTRAKYGFPGMLEDPEGRKLTSFLAGAVSHCE